MLKIFLTMNKTQIYFSKHTKFSELLASHSSIYEHFQLKIHHTLAQNLHFYKNT